jgi:endonuclease YncB( thermonuclease family)
MPFILIKGTFRLINRTQNGNETGFQPDGDSIHFKPRNRKLLDKLTRLQQPYRLTNIGSVQLRIEGIDALELHYRPTHGGPETFQPRSLADAARDFLIQKLRLNPVNYAPPRNLTVKPPAPNDGQPGYILSRSLEVHGRPVSFIFAGGHTAQDGSEVILDVPQLKKSLNYKAVLNGHAYPLFYDTLFADLRNALATAARQARKKKRGLWAQDGSQTGVRATAQSDLEQYGVTYPKLFRRLTDFLAETNGQLSDFPKWLAKKKEQVQDLDTTNVTHFDTFVEVTGNKVRMTKLPDRLLFVSAK